MADDTTRFIRGEQGSRLRLTGQDIIENPGVLDRNRPRETDEGIPAPPGLVENTPTADGTTPAQSREAAQRQAQQQLAQNTPEEGDQGRSPDSRSAAGEQNTGSGALQAPEPADARREGPPTAEREAAPVLRPLAPHYFVEQEHQAYYHDVIVYIEGQDVSDYLVGAISVTYGLGSSPNKCEIKLDNAGHKFTLTPENLQRGQFRSVSSIRNLGGGFDYAETAKAEIFDRKSNPGYNPVDRRSGGRRFPLHHWSTIFHKNDSIRAWIHNPASESDEWLPVFTGYVINKPISEDYITGENTISITCADIRHNMSKMRVNTNTVLAVLPGQQATASADPTNRQPFTGLRVFSPQSNQQFNRSFFQDLVATNNYNNPWSALRFRELIAALTFSRNTQRLVQGANGQVERRINASRRESLRRLSRQLSPLQQRVDANGIESLSRTERERYDALRNDVQQSGGSISETGEVSVGEDVQVQTVPTNVDTEDAVADTQPENTPEDPPGAEGSGIGSRGGRVRYEAAPPRGAGRIGRMRPGVFPWPGAHPGAVYPQSSSSDEDIRRFWQNWYNLLLFGTPVRSNLQSTQFAPSDPTLSNSARSNVSVAVEDGPPDLDVLNRKYWTEDQVRDAGQRTRREGAWQPDAQSVHMILPERSAPTSDLIFGAGIIGNSNVAQNLNWTNRLQLLVDACDVVDYRFWISGTGDMVFEFAQYDFSPNDYGAYSQVLTLDHHLLNESFDEEGGEVITAVVANGSYVGREDVQEGQDFVNFIPRSVGTWSPSLASRHGLNVRVKNYPQITSQLRLERLAMLEFQKLLAAADEYQIGVAFRPWLLINKPIYNKYRDRYALIDGIRWTLPITAGQVAGHQVPTYNLTLNYSRSVDELGIPRFITGGPSQPMYYGERRGGSGNILTALNQRIAAFLGAIGDLRSGEEPITSEELEELRDQYNALLPTRQDTFNVIDAALQAAVTDARGDGEISTTSQLLQSSAAACEEVSQNAGALTQEQIRDLLRQCEEQATAARETIRNEGRDPGPAQDPNGTRPDAGRSGVRSTIEQIEDQERPLEGPPPPEELCFPGDPLMFSAPLGRQSLSIVPTFAQWRRSIPSSRRRQTLIDFGHGRVSDPFDGTTGPSGIWQERGEFPRVTTSGFGRRRGKWHMGADMPATLGDPAYAVADGIVIQSGPGTGRGGTVALLHSQGFVTFYRHLDERLVEIGDVVKRHQQVATIGQAGQGAMAVAQTHLHFETAVIRSAPAYRAYVGSGKRFREVRGPQREELLATSAAARGETVPEGSSREARLGRIRLLDSIAPEGRDLASTRIIAQYGSARASLTTVSAELRDRFNLGFLRHRRGSDFTVPRTFLFYSPICLGDDPFNRPEQRGSSDGSSRTRNLISLREYYEQFGLKGVPTIGIPLVSSGLAPDTVPEIPASATGRRRRVLERRRDAVIRSNARKAQRLAGRQTARDQMRALYRDSVPPEECPPERYEGDTPRQPGEPLPERRRPTRTQASAAYRRRASLSGDSE